MNLLLHSVAVIRTDVFPVNHAVCPCSVKSNSAMAPPHRSRAESGDCSNFLSRALARRMKSDKSWIACRSIPASLNKVEFKGHWSTVPSALDLEGPLGVGATVVVGVAETTAWLLVSRLDWVGRDRVMAVVGEEDALVTRRLLCATGGS